MKKTDVLDIIKKDDKKIVSKFVYEKINKALSLNTEYDIELLEKGFVIKTKLSNTECGEYTEIKVNYISDIKATSILYINKEYISNKKKNYKLFSTEYSYVYDDKGKLLYSSWYSDDNNDLLNEGLFSNITLEKLKEYFVKTSPTYKNGVVIASADLESAPFYNIWERYRDTNVYREYRRNPKSGEINNVGITFNDKLIDDIVLFSEINGQVYTQENESCEFEIESAVSRLDTIFKNHDYINGFDLDGFYEEFDNTMIKRRIY